MSGWKGSHKPLIRKVPEVGIEPTRGCPHGILSPARRFSPPFGTFKINDLWAQSLPIRVSYSACFVPKLSHQCPKKKWLMPRFYAILAALATHKRYSWFLLQQSFIRKRKIFPLPYSDMIEYFNAQQLSCLVQACSDGSILTGGLYVPAWVVVPKNDSRSI
jgi:hypothetical protein